jgi:hypothetical protein
MDTRVVPIKPAIVERAFPDAFAQTTLVDAARRGDSIFVPVHPRAMARRGAASRVGDALAARALEVDVDRSRASAMLTMICPDCGFTQYVPRPGYVPHVRPQLPEQDFAAR